MRIGEAPAAKIRHRIGFAPDDIVQDPKAEILQDRADPENIVIGADDENRRVFLHDAAGGGKPRSRKIVVVGKAREFVPIVIDGIDEALVGPRERAFELQIVGRIGEDEIGAFRRQLGHLVQAIADKVIKGSTPRRNRASVAERAGEIPVRITLIWEFGPGAPARWLRMN